MHEKRPIGNILDTMCCTEICVLNQKDDLIADMLGGKAIDWSIDLCFVDWVHKWLVIRFYFRLCNQFQFVSYLCYIKVSVGVCSTSTATTFP